MQACIQSAVADAVAQEMARQKAAALSPAEQEKAQLDEREAALLAREQALVEREMRSFAREQLSRRKLPEALLDALCCQNEECCMESLNRVEQAFRTAVQEGVVEAVDGTLVPVQADSVCLHGDNPHAVAFAQKLRQALSAAGVAVVDLKEVLDR